MTMEASRLGLLRAKYAAITEEMAVNLRRASFSSVVREARDFSVALADASGEVFAQADCIPMLSAGISEALKGALKTLDTAALDADSAMLMNDPYSGGQHLPDIFLFSPLFHDKVLVGFAATVAHHVDIGGGYAGFAPDATEIFQEGIRLSPKPFSVSRDWHGGFVEQFIRGNVRVPDIVAGDLDAEFASNETARLRMTELMDRYGVDVCSQAMEELKDYAERRVRAAIAEIPDGVYEAEDVFDISPWGGDFAHVRTQVTVRGDALEVDFAGSSPQIAGNVNCPFASTVSAVHAAVRFFLNMPDLGFNEGCVRAISVTAPYGSALNPRPPAAVRARMTPACRVFDSVIRALGGAAPGNAYATSFSSSTSVAISHRAAAEGKYQVVLELVGSGWAASQLGDGADALSSTPVSNCSNAPVEVLETDYSHFRIIEFAFEQGTAGQGRFRGGRGVRRVYESVEDEVMVSGFSDRHRVGAQGAAGGGEGGVGSFTVLRLDGSQEKLPCVFRSTLNKGDRLVVVTGGGGGYGSATDRPAELLRADAAARVYS